VLYVQVVEVGVSFLQEPKISKANKDKIDSFFIKNDVLVKKLFNYEIRKFYDIKQPLI